MGWGFLVAFHALPRFFVKEKYDCIHHGINESNCARNANAARQKISNAKRNVKMQHRKGKCFQHDTSFKENNYFQMINVFILIVLNFIN